MEPAIQKREHESIEISTGDLLSSLGTDRMLGLSSDMAADRLVADGSNELDKGKSINALLLFFDQFKSSVVVLLLVATVLSLVMKEYLQTAGIAAALIINAVIGFLTEYRAQLSLQTLAKLAGAVIRVRRDGRELDLPVRELVPGDIVLLEAGNRVPADVRVLESATLSLDESPLTGESLPVWKSANADSQEGKIVYQGTSVQSGRAVGVVVATGNNTRMGKLGRTLQEVPAGQTPLTRSLDTLGHQLTILVVVLCAFFACLGIWRHTPIERMVETSIALAVAAIPEGLPVIATLALAAGIRRMVLNRALVRRLPAVETLGSTTVICTDKTGTLTENKMLVTDIVLPESHLELSGRGYEPTGELTRKDQTVALDEKGMHDLLVAICLCNDARLENHQGAEDWHIHGDPTEGSLLTAAVKLGLDDEKLRLDFPRVAEIPFDLNRKRMATVHALSGDGCVLYLKGAPESVLPICSQVRTGDRDVIFEEERRNWFAAKNQELARRGLRVLAVASRPVAKLPDTLESSYLERELVLLGLVGMSDRPKENVKEAISMCQRAGVHILMLTGDQPETARAIADELGIITAKSPEQAVLTGSELTKLSQQEVCEVLTEKQVSVLARATPEMKLDIVKRLQGCGNVVAMTGDGINDAPALRQSNIGVAMGLSGTDLAREAADLVITDDNFATIVKAIRQGRITYSNIRRAVAYLLTASLTSVIATGLGLIYNAGLFLEPLQLLYLNLIMHVMPGLGIVLQKGETDGMNRPPRKQSEKLLDRYEQVQIVVRSTMIGGICLAAVLIDQRYLGGQSSTTVALAVLSLALVLQSWSWLSTRGQSVQTPWQINGPMLFVTAFNLLLLLAAIYLPALQYILNTKALAPDHIILVLMAALITYFVSIPLSRLAWSLK